MECSSLYLFTTFGTLCNCHITCLLHRNYQVRPRRYCAATFPFSFFFWLFLHCILLRSTGQSGSEETALVIIHLSIFSHALLHYSHPSICTAIRVCHSNELQLASPVITTWAVLPFLTAFSRRAKLTLITAKVPFKCQSFSNHSLPCSYLFFHINRWMRRKDKRVKQPWDTNNKNIYIFRRLRRSYQFHWCPHLWECCGVTLAQGCVRHCRERGARSRGPCTRWSLFPGGRSAADLWGLWRLRRDQSRTWAAPSRPAVSQSQTGHNHKTTISSDLVVQDGDFRRQVLLLLGELCETANWILLENCLHTSWENTVRCGYEMQIVKQGPREIKWKSSSMAAQSSYKHVPQLSIQLDVFIKALTDFNSQVFK